MAACAHLKRVNVWVYEANKKQVSNPTLTLSLSLNPSPSPNPDPNPYANPNPNPHPHPHPKQGGGFERISCFDAPGRTPSTHTVHVLYRGGVHYDALVRHGLPSP